MPAGIETDILKLVGSGSGAASARGNIPASQNGFEFAAALRQAMMPSDAGTGEATKLLPGGRQAVRGEFTDVLPRATLQALIDGNIKGRITPPANDSAALAASAEAAAGEELKLADLIGNEIKARMGASAEDMAAADAEAVKALEAAAEGVAEGETDDAASAAAAAKAEEAATDVKLAEGDLPEAETDGQAAANAADAETLAENALPAANAVRETDAPAPRRERKVAVERAVEVHATPQQAASTTPAVAAAPAAETPAAGKTSPGIADRAKAILSTDAIAGQATDVPKQAAAGGADTTAAQAADADGKVFSLEAGAETADGIELQTSKSSGQTLGGAANAPTATVAATPTAAPAAAPPPVPAHAAMTAANGTIIAAPDDVVDIVSSRLAGAERPDRISIQLDPPELGRVSIEFRFDGQQLQHVAVTGDTPEAMTKLRQMHFQLVQSLEQHGLTARDMTFNQNSSQGDRQWSDRGQFASNGDGLAGDAAIEDIAAPRSTPVRLASSGLNIKL